VAKNQEIIDTGWNNYLKQLDDSYSYVDVGIVARTGAKNAIDEDGKQTGLTIAEVASINEFGTDTIPSRPFIRQTFDENVTTIDSLVDRKENEVLAGKSTRKDALMMIGQTHSNQIKKNIKTKGVFVANAPSTIRMKNGKDTPLINTGRLRASVDYEVG